MTTKTKKTDGAKKSTTANNGALKPKKAAVLRLLKKKELTTKDIAEAIKEITNAQMARDYAYQLERDGLVESSVYEDEPSVLYFKATAKGKKTKC